MERIKIGAIVAVLCMAVNLEAFQEIPKQSARCLGATRSKAFSSGAVFINGKYISAPYVVERYGTGIRINGNQVTGQIIDWNEFLKTQSGVKVNKTEVEVETPAPVAPAPVVTPAPAPQISKEKEVELTADSLDDLFDDDPKPAAAKKVEAPKITLAPAPVAVAPVQEAPKTKVAVSYSLEGPFVLNDAAKAQLARINAARTEIDKLLRSGGFICFGDNYSRVSGDDRTLMAMLTTMPEIMIGVNDLQSFKARIRSAGLVYINERLAEDLYRNRVDYRRLQLLRSKLRKDQQIHQVLRNSGSSLF